MEKLDRMLASMRSAFGAMGRRGGRWVDADGIGALVLPSVPERSVMNGVVYERGADVTSVYDELESLYTGVQAWTVWVPEEDTRTSEFLIGRGHLHDGSPAAMALDLATFEAPSELPSWERATPEQLGTINDAAYPWKDGSFERAARVAISPDDFHLYVAEDAAVLAIRDCDGDAAVWLVATLPEARGRGLAGGLLSVALLEARERGCDISTLQATRLGEPVYGRLGYEKFASIDMWEKRG
jgi:GNAT superfamily N-acetyltransferase